MKDEPTEIGGGAAPFVTTRWSMVLRAKASEGSQYRENFDALIRAYWKPVYSFLRRKWGESNEDAKDLTQAFFTDLLQRPFLSDVAPANGTFRSFLLACLRNFVHNAHDARVALKRGGSQAIVSLDFISAQGGADPADTRTPEEAFARSWEQTVLQETIRRLREAYAAEKREVYFAVFEAYDLSGDSQISYPAVAKRVGVAETDVTNYLAHARKRFRAIAQEVVRDSVFEDAQLPGEMRSLFGDSE